MNRTAVFTRPFTRSVGDEAPMTLAQAGESLTVIGPSQLSPSLWEIRLSDGSRHDATEDEFKFT